MSEKQNGKTQNKTEKKQPNPGKIALMGALATALAIFNMLPGTEAPSQAVMIMQYVFLAGGLIALAGALFMYMSQD